ncbi:hypothetical protein FSARC_9171 [Fusarium sarcochroum]|uniref:Uncharacterized protein n=1 Tax=Fusarium sarcochroum TaxID=1208366 RepID=A0A8H4TRM9_9HYPO|nr:hypothetical protein FSARC_9171 [Fusarium sarcochroum]
MTLMEPPLLGKYTVVQRGAYDFKRKRPTLKDQSGNSATPDDKFCVASSLGSSGSSPLTLTAFDVSSASSMTTYATISTTVEFDPEIDVLLAPVVTITFTVKPDGSTCVPDCDDPSQTNVETDY